MTLSDTLADFMQRLDAGPRGCDDAIAAIEKCAVESSTVLDLQQMYLTDKDLERLISHLPKVASHVTELNLFLNEYVTSFRVPHNPELFLSHDTLRR